MPISAYTVAMNKNAITPDQYGVLSGLLAGNGFQEGAVMEQFPCCIISLEPKDDEKVFGLYHSVLATTEPLSQEIINQAKKAGYELEGF